jgi:hypothetical protein
VLVALPMIANPYVAMGLIGSSYAALGWVLWPLVGTKVFNVGTGPVGQLLISCHRRQAMLSLTVVDVILQFAVVVPLAALYGVVGIVFAESGRLAGMVVLRHLVAYRLLSVHLLTRRYVQLFALSAGALVGSGVLAASVGGLRGYLIAVVTCGALYAALVTVLVRPRLRGLAGLRGGAGRADGAAP